MDKKWKVVVHNLTEKQAKVFAEWYSGQGEQDADVWFEAQEIETPMTDDTKTSVKNKTVNIYTE